MLVGLLLVLIALTIMVFMERISMGPGASVFILVAMTVSAFVWFFASIAFYNAEAVSVSWVGHGLIWTGLFAPIATLVGLVVNGYFFGNRVMTEGQEQRNVSLFYLIPVGAGAIIIGMIVNYSHIYQF